jgi:hypothetical protein
MLRGPHPPLQFLPKVCYANFKVERYVLYAQLYFLDVLF